MRKTPGEPRPLTEDAPDGAGGGRVDLAAVVLDALGQLDEGGVPGEAAFGPRRRKELLGTVVYGRAGVQEGFLGGGDLGRGARQA